MSDCITSNITLSAVDAINEEPDSATDISYYVKVDAAQSSIEIEFTNCVTATVSPATTERQPSNKKVKFTTDDIGTVFEIEFSWPQSDEGGASPGGPIMDPTMKPKFKPQGSCPP